MKLQVAAYDRRYGRGKITLGMTLVFHLFILKISQTFHISSSKVSQNFHKSLQNLVNISKKVSLNRSLK